ncbi:MAG: hypothetical protein [Bacteriophage sp.]|nr:MAG: hypothetical protein [Bacteriophage sp.]
MDEDALFINSTACNEFMRHRDEREEIAADVDTLKYFNQVAIYHFIPLLNEKLPIGCRMAYRSTLPCNGDYFISVRVNNYLRNVVYDVNDNNKWDVYCDYVGEYFRAEYDLDGNGLSVNPNLSNSDSTQLAAFLKLIGWDLESDSVNQKLYDELTKRYNEMGGLDSLYISRV